MGEKNSSVFIELLQGPSLYNQPKRSIAHSWRSRQQNKKKSLIGNSRLSVEINISVTLQG